MKKQLWEKFGDDVALERMIDRKEYAALRGTSVKTLDRQIKAGQVPKPTKISERCERWKLRDALQTLDADAATAAA